MLGATDYFLLHLDPDPLDEAFVVDWAAGSVALAGIEQEVIHIIMLFEAYLAGGPLDSWVVSEPENILIKVKFWILHRSSVFIGSIRALAYIVLNSSQFERHPRL